MILNQINSKKGVAALVLQSKSVTPTKSEQIVRADDGFDALEEAIIEPIPDNYIDPADATATAAVVGLGETFYAGDGTQKTGTFTLDEELETQEDKLAELMATLNGKSKPYNISFSNGILRIK